MQETDLFLAPRGEAGSIEWKASEVRRGNAYLQGAQAAPFLRYSPFGTLATAVVEVYSHVMGLRALEHGPHMGWMPSHRCGGEGG